jgi:hypothetical protein
MDNALTTPPPTQAHVDQDGWRFTAWIFLCTGIVVLADSGWRPSASMAPMPSSWIAINAWAIAVASFLPLLGSAGRSTRLMIASATIPFCWLAAMSEGRSGAGLIQLSLQMALFVALCPTIWAMLRQARVWRDGFAVMLLFSVVGMPMLSYLSSDFGIANGWPTHFCATRWIASTFSH